MIEKLLALAPKSTNRQLHFFVPFNFGVYSFLYMPQFRNLTNSLRALRSKPPRMRFLLFKLAFCHVLTDMIV